MYCRRKSSGNIYDGPTLIRACGDIFVRRYLSSYNMTSIERRYSREYPILSEHEKNIYVHSTCTAVHVLYCRAINRIRHMEDFRLFRTSTRGRRTANDVPRFFS